VIVLDENIIESQCLMLRKWRIRYRQIGSEVGKQGMGDSQVVALLHNLRQPTFFTRDDDFYDRGLAHSGHCLVYLCVGKAEAASFVRRFLHHPAFDTNAKRMGSVVRVSHGGLWAWRAGADGQAHLEWGDRELRP
jgi:hypothetical protein